MTGRTKGKETMNDEKMETERTESMPEAAIEKLEGEQTPAIGDAAEEEVKSEAEDGASKRKRRIVIGLVAAVVVLAACALGAAPLAGSGAAPEPAPAETAGKQAEEGAAVKDYDKIALAVEVKAEGWTDAATRAKIRIEATAPHGEAEPIEIEVPCNEVATVVDPGAVVLGAKYLVSVVEAPVLEDGSTYTEPDVEPFAVESSGKSILDEKDLMSEIAFDPRLGPDDARLEDVEGGGIRAIVHIDLEPVSAADMSEEEIAASIAALEAAGNGDAAQVLANNGAASSRADERDGGSNSTEQASPAPTPETPSASVPDPTPQPDPEPQPESCPHNWIAETKFVGHDYCSLCGAIVDNNAGEHMKAHALAGQMNGSVYSDGTDVPTGREYCPMCEAYR